MPKSANAPLNPAHVLSSSTQAYIATLDIVGDNAWYPDSGAIYHLTHSPAALGESAPYSGPGKVYVGNGNAIPVLQTSQSSITHSRPLYIDLYFLCLV